jgi:tight adherence protein B
MLDLLFILFVSLTAAAFTWGVMLLVLQIGTGERRKLQQRLTSVGGADPDATAARLQLIREQSASLPRALRGLPVLRGMPDWLAQGLPHARLSRFLLTLVTISFTLAALAGLLSGNLVMAAAGAVLGIAGPVFFVNNRRAARKRLFTLQLPEALDFLARVLRAGQSFSTALQMMADELPKPIGGEFRRCYDQHSLGQSIEDGLRDMARRVDSSDFAFFATAVIIQRQSGGDLAEVLRTISDTVRKRIRLGQSVKSKTAEGRLTGYVMVAFPSIMFALTYFIDPNRGNIMLFTPAGHVLIGLAVGLQVFGLFLIRKITAVNV